jgi:hypothetical protein
MIRVRTNEGSYFGETVEAIKNKASTGQSEQKTVELPMEWLRAKPVMVNQVSVMAVEGNYSKYLTFKEKMLNQFRNLPPVVLRDMANDLDDVYSSYYNDSHGQETKRRIWM